MKMLMLPVVLGVTLALPAQADEMSPWFGGEGSDAFQVSVAAVQVSISETSPLMVLPKSCELPDCPAEAKLAKEASSAVAP